MAVLEGGVGNTVWSVCCSGSCLSAHVHCYGRVVLAMLTEAMPKSV
jgi:hypothetical protein